MVSKEDVLNEINNLISSFQELAMTHRFKWDETYFDFLKMGRCQGYLSAWDNMISLKAKILDMPEK